VLIEVGVNMENAWGGYSVCARNWEDAGISAIAILPLALGLGVHGDFSVIDNI